MPATLALVTIGDPIVCVLFERGAFDAAATENTAAALSAFSVGLPAYVLIKALTPGFFARQDTLTPVKIAIAAMVVNVVLALILMQVLSHVGIAMATAGSAWMNAIILWVILHRRGQFHADARLWKRGIRTHCRIAGDGRSAFLRRKYAEHLFDGHRFGTCRRAYPFGCVWPRPVRRACALLWCDESFGIADDVAPLAGSGLTEARRTAITPRSLRTRIKK